MKFTQPESEGAELGLEASGTVCTAQPPEPCKGQARGQPFRWTVAGTSQPVTVHQNTVLYLNRHMCASGNVMEYPSFLKEFPTNL